MSTYREYSRKITALNSMRRITRTMRMVSAGHLRRAQEILVPARAYEADVRRVNSHWADLPDTNHAKRGAASARNALLIVISSDRGLCGGFNGQLIRHVREWLSDQRPRWNRIRVTFIGKRAWQVLRRDVEVRRMMPLPPRGLALDDAARMGMEVAGLFQARKYSAIYLAYNRHLGGIRSAPEVMTLLSRSPAPASTKVESKQKRPKTIVEGDPDDLVRRAQLRLVIARIRLAATESATAEHAARMAAMDSASHNIDKLIHEYTLLRNAARQSSITRDLNEVVSAAESLAG